LITSVMKFRFGLLETKCCMFFNNLEEVKIIY